jgi:hypothetical protein
LTELARTLRELVTRRQPVALGKAIGKRQRFEPGHITGWAFIADAVAGPVRHQAAAIGDTKGGPFSLRQFELADTKRAR